MLLLVNLRKHCLPQPCLKVSRFIFLVFDRNDHVGIGLHTRPLVIVLNFNLVQVNRQITIDILKLKFCQLGALLLVCTIHIYKVAELGDPFQNNVDKLGVE